MPSKLSNVVPLSMLLLTMSVACASSTPPAKVLPTPGVPANSFPADTFAIGNWSLEFKGEGTYTLKADGLEENGAYAVTGDQVTLQGERCAKLGIEKGVYRWNFDGKILSFKALDDICMERLSRLEGSNWTKQS